MEHTLQPNIHLSSDDVLLDYMQYGLTTGLRARVHAEVHGPHNLTGRILDTLNHIEERVNPSAFLTPSVSKTSKPYIVPHTSFKNLDVDNVDRFEIFQ